MNVYQELLQLANPACVRCHGRAVICATGHEFMGMYGSERACQDFYEEDFCNCLSTLDPELEICDMLVEMEITIVHPYALTLFDRMHWDCVHCALQFEKDMRCDAELENTQLEAEIDSMTEEIERRIRA